MSIFHQHSHPTLKYCSNMLCQSISQDRSMLWEIGATPGLYKISKSSKPPLKINEITFTKIQWYQKPLTFYPVLQSLYHPLQHVTYRTHKDTGYQSSHFSCHYLSLSSLLYLSTFTCIYLMSTFFSRSTTLEAT